MTENPEFDLDSAWLAPGEPTPGPAEPAPGPPVAPEPVVVIQYRNRGLPPVLMLPIALVASLAALAGYHAYVEPAAGHAAPPAPAPAAALDDSVARAAAAFAKEEAPLPLPLTLEGRPLPPGEPATPAEAVAAAPPPPTTPEPAAPPPAVEADAADADRPRISIASASPTFVAPTEPAPPPAAEAVTPAAPAPAADLAKPAEAPLPTQEEMMERIRQEAELKEIRREEMERRQAEEVERLKVESIRRVEEERSQFRRELRGILKGEPSAAGPAIDALCEQFGRVYNAGVRERANAILAHNKGRLTGDAEVRILRSLGVPEPAVLDFLCNRLNRSLHSRNGPHDADEVRVVAARQLLRIPTTAAAPAGPTPPPPSPARSPVYRRSAAP